MKPDPKILTTFDAEYLTDLLNRLKQARFPDREQIDALQQALDNADVQTPVMISPEVIRIDCVVRVVDLQTGKKKRYTIVLPECADMAKRLLSVTTPLGLAFLGRRQGDAVQLNAPGGIRMLRIEHVRQLARSILFEQQRCFHVAYR